MNTVDERSTARAPRVRHIFHVAAGLNDDGLQTAINAALHDLAEEGARVRSIEHATATVGDALVFSALIVYESEEQR